MGIELRPDLNIIFFILKRLSRKNERVYRLKPKLLRRPMKVVSDVPVSRN